MNLKCVGGFVLGVLLALMAGILPVNYLNGPKALGFVLGAVILVADIFIAKFVVRYRREELYKAAVMGLQLFLIVVLLFNLVKLGWGRERFRHMMEIGTVAGFSPWFIPQGLAAGNEFMSFPSGHSANAAIVMWITLLPTFLPSLATKEKLLKVFACIWIALVMVSRIIMGAHFLSDVTMGMMISLVTFYVLYKKKYQ